MTNQNQEAFEQMKRFTKAAKNLYGNNYSPGAINPQYQTKFFFNMAGLGKLNDMAHIGLNVIGGTLSGKSLSNPYKNVKNFLSSNNNLRDFYKQGISLYNKFKF